MIRKLRPLRYIGYTLLFLLWLVVMLTPCFAFALASRGEISWQRGEYDGDRIWLIQERDQKGIGYRAERIISDQRPTAGPLCVKSTIRFFLWEGSAEGQNTDYCECYVSDGTQISGECP
ncbi:MAG: hypothetical protein AAB382_01985 [Chloroflexota bacterium]